LINHDAYNQFRSPDGSSRLILPCYCKRKKSEENKRYQSLHKRLPIVYFNGEIKLQYYSNKDI